MARYFPKRFGTSANLNHLAQQKAYLIAQLRHALEPTDETEQTLDSAFAVVVGQHSPAIFQDNEQNTLVTMEKSYASLGVTLAELGCSNFNALNVFEFYSWIETHENKYEAQKAALKPKPNAAKPK